jgi:parvulin-like peptidyl-prolyl isomerase
MSRAQANPRMTRKHMARAQRDRVLSRWIIGVMIAIGTVVVGLVAFAFLGVNYIEARQPIIEINGEVVTIREYKARVRLVQFSMINECQNIQNILQFYADDPSITTYYQQRLDQLAAELNSPFTQGQQAIQELMDEVLMRQAAIARGITVSRDEIDAAVAVQAFSFYRDGTPTPQPSPTADPTALASIAATSTPSPEVGTPTSSPTPNPTPTAYTEEAFLVEYADRMQFYEEIGILEEDYLALFEADLYAQRLRSDLEQELPTEEDQVWLRHIQVADVEEAQDVRERLRNGESWDDLAAELSLDVLTSNDGGDLGWLGHRDVVSRHGEIFGIIAFSLSVDEFSGPVESNDGWHIIHVIGHEVRPLSETTLVQRLQEAYDELLAALMADAEVVIDDSWVEYTPHAYDLARDVAP